MLEIGQKITAQVEKVVFQGKGLIRYQGLVIFVDDVMTLEEVVVEITQVKKSYCTARLVEIKKPSQFRRKPRCPYFGVCGGCQLQHIDYEVQLDLKRNWVQEALCQVAPNKTAIVSAENEWEYRRKITLHYEYKNEKLTLGYYKKDNRTLLDISECPIFSKGHFSFTSLRRLLQDLLKGSSSSGDLSILKCDDEAQHVWYLIRIKTHQVLKNKPGFQPKLDANWLKVVLESGKEVCEFVQPQWSGKELFDTVLGLKIFISPTVFLQNYPEQSHKIYQDVVGLIGPGSKVLDLYCGVGILSLLLVRAGSHVIAIESSREAIALAKKSQAYNKLLGARFIAGLVEDELKKAIKGKKREDEYKTWIINPPREGLSEKMRGDILHYLPEELLYVSCMPSTLVRDLKELTKEHYELCFSKAYDMFPETTHVETLVKLKRRN